jgi:hypothetical protein
MVNFETKIPNLGNLGGSCNIRCCYILWPFGLFYGHLVYFIAIWYILLPFGIFCCHLVYPINFSLVYFPPILVYCTKKNLSTLKQTMQFLTLCVRIVESTQLTVNLPTLMCFLSLPTVHCHCGMYVCMYVNVNLHVFDRKYNRKLYMHM